MGALCSQVSGWSSCSELAWLSHRLGGKELCVNISVVIHSHMVLEMAFKLQRTAMEDLFVPGLPWTYECF